jgi:Zn-finger protein
MAGTCRLIDDPRLTNDGCVDDVGEQSIDFISQEPLKNGRTIRFDCEKNNQHSTMCYNPKSFMTAYEMYKNKTSRDGARIWYHRYISPALHDEPNNDTIGRIRDIVDDLSDEEEGGEDAVMEPEFEIPKYLTRQEFDGMLRPLYERQAAAAHADPNDPNDDPTGGFQNQAQQVLELFRQSNNQPITYEAMEMHNILTPDSLRNYATFNGSPTELLIEAFRSSSLVLLNVALQRGLSGLHQIQLDNIPLLRKIEESFYEPREPAEINPSNVESEAYYMKSRPQFAVWKKFVDAIKSHTGLHPAEMITLSRPRILLLLLMATDFKTWNAGDRDAMLVNITRAMLNQRFNLLMVDFFGKKFIELLDQIKDQYNETLNPALRKSYESILRYSVNMIAPVKIQVEAIKRIMVYPVDSENYTNMLNSVLNSNPRVQLKPFMNEVMKRGIQIRMDDRLFQAFVYGCFKYLDHFDQLIQVYVGYIAKDYKISEESIYATFGQILNNVSKKAQFQKASVLFSIFVREGYITPNMSEQMLYIFMDARRYSNMRMIADNLKTPLFVDFFKNNPLTVATTSRMLMQLGLHSANDTKKEPFKSLIFVDIVALIEHGILSLDVLAQAYRIAKSSIEHHPTLSNSIDELTGHLLVYQDDATILEWYNERKSAVDSERRRLEQARLALEADEEKVRTYETEARRRKLIQAKRHASRW